MLPFVESKTHSNIIMDMNLYGGIKTRKIKS
jgi:hypothetical protein